MDKKPAALMTATQIAEQIGFNKRKIPQLVRAGMPYIQYGKKQIRFTYQQVLAWWESKCISESSQKDA